MKRISIFSLLALVSLSFFSYGQNDHKNSNNCEITGKEVMLKDVDVFRHDHSIAKGAFLLKNNDSFLVTAEHLFPIGREDFYFIIVNNDTLYVSSLEICKDDAAILKLGKEKKLFKGFSKFKGGTTDSTEVNKCIIFKPKFFQKIFSLCGDSATWIGYVQNENQEYLGIIIDIKTKIGESGTVFYDNTGGIFVLSRCVNAHDNKKLSVLLKDKENFTVLMPVGFSIKENDYKTGDYQIIGW